MPNLIRIALVLMIWLASLTGCSEGAEVEFTNEGDGIELAVPQEYRVTSNSSFLYPDPSGLEEQGELLVKLPISMLGFDDPSMRRSGQPQEVMLRIVSTVDSKNNAVTDAQHAWLGTDLYQERVIENDPEVGMTRIYPKSGHPLIWNYFRSNPELSSTAALEGHWVASCRLKPGSTDTSGNGAQCISRFFWNTFQVEFAFPGTLVQDFTAFREAVIDRLDSWTQTDTG